MQHPPTPPPEGWFDDPDDPRQVRWWDGREWTDHRQPKAPGMTMSGQTGRPAQFRSTAGVANVVYGLLAVTTLLAVFEATADTQFAMDNAGMAWFVSLVATGIAFFVFFHRAYSNLRALGVPRLRYGTGWAIGAWFIPLAAYVIPAQIAHDIARGSDPEAPDRLQGNWTDREVHPLVTSWWIAWVVYGVTLNFASSPTGRQVVMVIGLAAAAGCAAYVHRITTGQAVRFERLQRRASDEQPADARDAAHDIAA